MGSYWSGTEDHPGDTVNQNMACNRRDTTFQPKKLRKPGVTILKEILKTIKLDDDLIGQNNNILHTFLETFINEMRNQDDLFSSLFQNVHYTGSFYSDLRISTPDEFDINVVLKMPFRACDFQVEYNSHVPSYATYRLKSLETYTATHSKLLRELFSNGYLIPENVRRWMQGVIDKALKSYRLPQSIISITPSASGPARTIKLRKRNSINDIIDIDLVPVIACNLDTKQPGIDGRICAKLGSTVKAFLVPKPYSPPSGKQLPVNSIEISRLWRTHFPDAENSLLVGQSVKPIIKLLKLLRDQEDWKIIASYYLKTVVMWMLLEKPDPELWKDDKIDERFIEALQKLELYVRDKKIPYFFSKKHNLISKINDHQAINISNRLSVIIKDVLSDPWKFWKYFNVTPSF